jgi:glycerol-3-phosphate dehydrogenase (NAD(P)+)
MSDLASSPVAILGAGSWGTALAYSLATHGGHAVKLWARRRSLAVTLRETRRNADYLPNVELPESVRVSDDPAEIVASSASRS